VKILYTEEALADLEGFLSYIAERSPAAAASVAARIDAAITKAPAAPRSAST